MLHLLLGFCHHQNLPICCRTCARVRVISSTRTSQFIISDPFIALRSLLGWTSIPLHEQTCLGQRHHSVHEHECSQRFLLSSYIRLASLGLYQALANAIQRGLIGVDTNRNIVENKTSYTVPTGNLRSNLPGACLMKSRRLFPKSFAVAKYSLFCCTPNNVHGV
jgi:hypothetical protein